METVENNNKNLVSPDVKDKFNILMEPFFSQYYRERCYPGLIFKQGKRKMLQIHVPAKDLLTLLQAKPSTNNDPDSGKNRPEVKGHADEIKDYIVERSTADKPWVVGTITANVDEEKIILHELGRGVCIVVIPNGVKLDITDGQHRKSAIQALELSAESHLISDDDFAITLILEGDHRQCQTDFRDMAQTKQLDKSLLLSFGEFEGVVGIAKHLIENVYLFQNKVEKIGNTPATKKKLIYTMNYLVRFINCVFYNNPKSEDLEGCDVYQLSEALADCLNNFFSLCKDTIDIADTTIDRLTIRQIELFKVSSLLGVSVGLEVLGKLLYCAYDPETISFDNEKILQISELDWSRRSSLWQNNIIRKSDNNSYEVVNRTTTINDAIQTIKNQLGWI
jgi:DNA sulfur modification protein DndB